MQGVEFDPKVLAKGLEEIYRGMNVRDEIQNDIFRETLRLFNEAASKGLSDSTWADDVPDEFINQLRTNNAIWTAFRTHRMQNDIAAQLLDEKGNLKPFERWVKDIKGMTNHYVHQWLKTEYNTAILRAHQAADWKHFEAEQDVFPNIRWMPTTSPQQDLVHAQYWRNKLTLPVNHPFWKEHRPGDRWNCKCSLEQTDEPTNDEVIKDFKPVAQQAGLENNPGEDGKIFSDTHPYVAKAYPGAKGAVQKKVLVKRQKTQQEKQEIRRRWEVRRLRAQLPDNLTDAEKDAIAANSYELQLAMKIKVGKPMTVEEADKQSANRNWGKPGYDINCQTCCPAYLLRTRGFDITAVNKPKSRIVAYEIWKNADGSDATFTHTYQWMRSKGYGIMTPQRYEEFFEESCKEVGIYEILIKWKGGGRHATILQRFEDGELRYIEPQKDNSKGSSHERHDLDWLCNSLIAKPYVYRGYLDDGVMRIDNKIFDKAFYDSFDAH